MFCLHSYRVLPCTNHHNLTLCTLYYSLLSSATYTYYFRSDTSLPTDLLRSLMTHCLHSLTLSLYHPRYSSHLSSLYCSGLFRSYRSTLLSQPLSYPLPSFPGLYLFPDPSSRSILRLLRPSYSFRCLSKICRHHSPLCQLYC